MGGTLRRLFFIVAGSVALLLFQWFHATIIPGQWAKVDSLETGSPVSVTLRAGNLIQGSITGRTNRELLLETPDGTLQFPLEEVHRVVVPAPQRDGLVNGTLLGLAAGLAFGGVLVATDGSGGIASEPGRGGLQVEIHSGDSGRAQEAAIVAGSAAVGALFGLLIDASEKDHETRHETIYLAP